MKSLTQIANEHYFNTTYTNEFDMDQAGGTLITPTTGNMLKVRGVYINTEATTGYLRIWFGDDENDQVNTVLTTFAASGPVSGYVPVRIDGDTNAPLKITSTLGAGQNYFIAVNYREEK